MNAEEKKVFKALLHPKYEWRTVSGIAKQTGLPEERVEKYLHHLIKQKKVRKSFVPDHRGNDLYGLIVRVDAEME